MISKRQGAVKQWPPSPRQVKKMDDKDGEDDVSDLEQKRFADEKAILTTKVDQSVTDLTESVFKFAITRHRKAQPHSSFQPKLKGFQYEGLGWLLDREGYTSLEREKLDGKEWNKSISTPIVWTKKGNVGIVISTPPIEDELVPQPPTRTLKDEVERNVVRGGILADEMGLGKTAQMIALIATHRNTVETSALPTTLVVVPRVLLQNWMSELRKFAPGLKKMEHYGSDRERKNVQVFAKFHVVVTTYTTLQKDLQMMSSVKWWRIVLDEAHFIKNPETKNAEACYTIDAVNRWAMSGTPIQNTWRDFFSLLKFLHVKPYGEFQGWARMIELPIMEPGDTAEKRVAVQVLRSLVKSLVLRRTKDTQEMSEAAAPVLALDVVVMLVDDDKQKRWRVFDTTLTTFSVEDIDPVFETRLPIRQVPYIDTKTRKPTYTFLKELVHIPKKTIYIVPLKFNTKDEQVYKQLAEQAVSFGKKDINNALEQLLRMRQLTIHPWLLEPEKFKGRLAAQKGPASGANKVPFEPGAKIDYLVNDLNETRFNGTRQDEKSLVFSQFTRALDLIELALVQNGWMSESDYQNLLKKAPKKDLSRIARFVRIDGSTSAADRVAATEKLASEPGVKVMLLSLFAASVGLNLVAANNVYFMDLFFNPQTHAQAIDRTHRIGQIRPVNVTYLVIKDTIEDQVLKLQRDKREIATTILKPTQLVTDVFNLIK